MVTDYAGPRFNVDQNEEQSNREVLFEDEIRSANPSILEHEIGAKIDDQFAEWFKNFVHVPSNNVVNKFVQDLAKGPLTQ
ncbi:hypothetical protein OROHE_003471 [Orobanche hederae]